MSDYEFPLELLAIFGLVVANAFFVLAEFAIVASRASRLSQKKTEGKLGASTALKLRNHPEQFLASMQVGVTLVGAMMGVFSGATMVEELQALLSSSSIPFLRDSAATLAMALMIAAITTLTVVLGELVPKYLALTNPERLARFIAGPASFFLTITRPFARLFSLLAHTILRTVGVRADHAREGVNEEEINQMLVEGKQKGVFDDTEQEFVRSVFDFSHSTVRRAMTPRTDVIGFEKEDSPERIMKLIIEYGYSRYPVYEETIDNVIGVVYTKDLTTKKVDPDQIDIAKLMREPLFVADSMPLPRVLREFQKGKGHLAVVVDEFGGTAGVISIEDVLEELVGEIQDEYDAEVAPLIKHSDTMLYANADVWPGDVNEQIDTHLPEEDYDTLSGLILEELGRLPEKQESVEIADVRLTVLVKDKNRLLRLKLEKLRPKGED